MMQVPQMMAVWQPDAHRPYSLRNPVLAGPDEPAADPVLGHPNERIAEASTWTAGRTGG